MTQQHKSSNNLGLKIGLSLVGVIAVSTIVYTRRMVLCSIILPQRPMQYTCNVLQ